MPKPLSPGFKSDIRIRLEWVAMVISIAYKFLPPPEWVASKLQCSLGKWGLTSGMVAKVVNLNILLLMSILYPPSYKKQRMKWWENASNLLGTRWHKTLSG